MQSKRTRFETEMTHRYVYRCEGVSLVDIKQFDCMIHPRMRKPRMGSTFLSRVCQSRMIIGAGNAQESNHPGSKAVIRALGCNCSSFGTLKSALC